MRHALRGLLLTFGLLALCLPCGYCAALGGAFDDIPIGARARAMGGAYTAVCDDASGIYWNPSSLGRIHKSELDGFDEDLYSLGLINYSFLGFVYPGLGDGAMGFGWTRLGTTQSANIQNYAENTYIISYGQPISRRAYVGASVKFFSVDYDVKAAGYGADAAVSYDIMPERMSAAFVWQNVNRPEIRWDSGAVDNLDSVFRLGFDYKIAAVHTFSVDASQKYGHETEYSLGWESLLFSRIVAVRVGGNEIDGVLNPAAGVGLHFGRIKLDCTLEQNYNLGQSVLLGFTYMY